MPTITLENISGITHKQTHIHKVGKDSTQVQLDEPMRILYLFIGTWVTPSIKSSKSSNHQKLSHHHGWLRQENSKTLSDLAFYSKVQMNVFFNLMSSFLLFNPTTAVIHWCDAIHLALETYGHIAKKTIFYTEVANNINNTSDMGRTWWDMETLVSFPL